MSRFKKAVEEHAFFQKVKSLEWRSDPVGAYAPHRRAPEMRQSAPSGARWRRPNPSAE